MYIAYVKKYQIGLAVTIFKTEAIRTRFKIDSLGPRQNGRHFAHDILECIFCNENIWILIEISVKFVPKGPIDNDSPLIQVMTWHQRGPKPYLNQ